MRSNLFHACLFLLVASALGSIRQRRAVGFTFKDCGNAGTAKATFNDLKLEPDPLDYPGTVKISTNFDVKSTLPNDVQVGVRLIKLNPDLAVPCMDNFGSCDYDACGMLTKYKDLCSLFPTGATCACPVPSGHYDSDKIHVTLPNFGPIFGQILQGDFKGNLTLFSKSSPNTILACAHVTFTIKYVQ